MAPNEKMHPDFFNGFHHKFSVLKKCQSLFVRSSGPNLSRALNLHLSLSG